MALDKDIVLLILFLSLCCIPIEMIGDKNDTTGCSQPRATGPCRNKLLRFAYDGSSGQCISFYYSGCGATKNNFLTYEECRRDCMRQIRY